MQFSQRHCTTPAMMTSILHSKVRPSISSPIFSVERKLVHELMIKHHTFHLTYQPRVGLAQFALGRRFYRSSSETVCMTEMQMKYEHQNKTRRSAKRQFVRHIEM